MEESIMKLIPIILLFIVGYIAKMIKLFQEKDADMILKYVFNLTAPALIILSISKAQLSFDYILLSLGAMIIILIIWGVSKFAGERMKLPSTTLGVLIMGTMIINTGFQMPFIYAIFGEEGIVRFTMFDSANSFLMFTLVYYQAIKYGTKKGGISIYKKFLSSAPLWGLFIGLVLNFMHITIGGAMHKTLEVLASTMIPLVMVSLGIYFVPQFKPIQHILPAIIIRMGFGFVIGIGLAYLLQLDGLNRTIFVICAGAPVGFTTIIFSGMEGLDKNYASSIVSLSILIGMVMTPVMIFMLV